MSVTLLILLSTAIGVISIVFKKLCSNIMAENSAAKFSLLLIINSVVACGFFFVSGGFKLSVNAPTLIYSSVYALIVAISVVADLLVLRYVSISNANITTNVAGMICTALLGWLLFSEDLDAIKILRIAIMIVAIILEFLEQKNKTKSISLSSENDRKNVIAFVLTVTAITGTICANTVILKLFSLSTAVTDENSFFFFTNR